MVELIPGKGIYLFQGDLACAQKKSMCLDKEGHPSKSGDKMARFLMSKFFDDAHLVNKTISKKPKKDNGRVLLNPHITDTIIGKDLSQKKLHNNLSHILCYSGVPGKS